MNVGLQKKLTGIRVLTFLNGAELFGHERGNIEVYKALGDMGAKVRVGVGESGVGGDVGEELRRLGFETFAVPYGGHWSFQWLKKIGPSYVISQIRRIIQCSKTLRAQIREFEPTHIHLGSTLVYSFLSVAIMLSRQPLIWRMGDCPPIDSRFNLIIWKIGIRCCRRVVAISNYVKTSATAEGVPDEKVEVIYNLAPTCERDANCNSPPQLMGGERALIYAGAVSEHKGLFPLVSSFAEVAEKDNDLRLWILGQSTHDGGFRKLLQKRVRELKIERHVHFAGHVTDLKSWYATASVHVVPSIWEEPSGNVVLEAKREGTPSIVFPSGGLPELIQHKVDGYVCKEKSADSLAEGIRWVLEDSERLRKMRTAAKEDSEKRFGRDRFLNQWADIYSSVGL